MRAVVASNAVAVVDLYDVTVGVDEGAVFLDSVVLSE